MAFEEKIKGSVKELGGFKFEGKIKNSGDVEGEAKSSILSDVEGLQQVKPMIFSQVNTSKGFLGAKLGFDLDT